MLQVLGDVRPKGILLHDRDVKFREDMAESSKRRYRQTSDDKAWLFSKGFQAVTSSNVSALGIFGKDLYIRFLNDAVYRYPNNAELFEKIMRANSKGRAVWKYIRRAGVPYERVGDMPIPDVITNDELFKGMETTKTAYNELFKFKELSEILTIEELALTISQFKTIN